MSARDYALFALDDRDLPGWRAHGVRGRRIDPLDERDRALGERIWIGVVKNLLHLQYLVQHFSNRTLTSVDPVVQKVLAIALYQLRFLTQIPASAAVDEAVEQVRRVGRPNASGLVNAILRNAIRQPDVPLPDPATHPHQYAQRALSHPKDVFDRFARLLGAADAIKLCARNNEEPPTIIRLIGQTNIAQLEQPGIEFQAHAQVGMYVVEGAKQSDFADWAARGLAQVQDATAALVAAMCDVKPGDRVLDRCAGLGTKTLQLSDAAGASGFVVAIDPAPQRIAGLNQLIQRRKAINIRPIQAAMMAAVKQPIPEVFDKVLVDAPCSNSGVFSRRPEARYAQHEKSLRSLERLQLDILKDTAPRVAPGGRLVYSTCSVWPEENQRIVQTFLRDHAEFELMDEKATLPAIEPDPTQHHDGGYAAVLRRR